MSTHRFRHVGVIVAMLFPILLCISCTKNAPPPVVKTSAPPPPIETSARSQLAFEGRTMGTTWHATVVHPPVSDAEFEALRVKIQESLDDVDRRMTTYSADSEIGRFNRAPANQPFAVSAETMTVVQKALEVAKLSGGAFDPTVEPLVELWGFGPKDQTDQQPSQPVIDTAAALVDYRFISANPAAKTLTKIKEGVQLDLSAIAKGFGVDQACRVLDGLGYKDYVVEAGGEVRAKGKNRDGVDWRVGVDKPEPGKALGEEIQFVISLADKAIATSGDYRNYREVGGRRVSHTIDPALKGPIQHNLASVSIIASTCMEADALATAVDVLGPGKGMRFLAAQPNVEGYLIVRTAPEKFQPLQTPGFGKYIIE